MAKLSIFVIGMGFYLLFLPMAGQSAELVAYSTKETVTFSGSGTTTTKPFSVKGEWDLKWKAEGFIAIHVYNLKSRLNEKLMFVYSANGGKGESYHPDPGTFFLNIVATEPWSVSIRELTPQAD